MTQHVHRDCVENCRITGFLEIKFDFLCGKIFSNFQFTENIRRITAAKSFQTVNNNVNTEFVQLQIIKIIFFFILHDRLCEIKTKFSNKNVLLRLVDKILSQVQKR